MRPGALRPASAAAAFCAAAVFASAAPSQDIELGLPIDCRLGATCHIQNHVDRNDGPGRADYACGGLSYDEHAGTDFALPDLRAMRRGVDVLAAAGGTVRATRDVWPDISIRRPEAPDLDGQDCGNGVVIDHGDGLSTQYCHLMFGSVDVRTGDEVEAGDTLGKVGLSGRTEFPHLHFTVRRGDETVDPFDAEGSAECGEGRSLWRETPDYAATGIIAAGIAPRLPTYEEVQDTPPTDTSWPAAEGEAIVAWAHGFGLREGDVVRLALDGPGGVLHRADETIDGDLAAFFRGGGRRAPAGGWPPGDYAGRIEIVRDGAVIAARAVAATLTAP